MEVIWREGEKSLGVCTILKLMMAEESLSTDSAVCLGWAGFLGVLGKISTGVSGGVSGTLKDLAAEVIGMAE